MIDEDNHSVNPTYNEQDSFLSKAFNRREALKLGSAGLGSLSLLSTPSCKVHDHQSTDSFLPFEEPFLKQKADIQLAEGYKYQKIIGFGDPLKPGLTPYDPKKLTEEEQKNRFGGQNDYIHFFQDSHDKGVLCVNNEFPEFGEHPDLSEREKAAYYSVGCSIVGLKKNRNWSVNLSDPINRRITPKTPGIITGPAAGNNRLKSTFSPDGIKTAGTLGNCAGGFTPWGTYLTAEENIQQYFEGDINKHPEKDNMLRFGMKGKSKDGFFHKIDKRFDLNSNEQSPLHFGWIVEIDPYNPQEPIRKHSALGRTKHECATMTIDKNGHAVVYTSDDQTFEYLYKFISKKKYIPGNRKHNLTLLEEGTLYVAKFQENGILDWLPLTHGQGPLTENNGFISQGDILLDTRSAADALGATPMDRPEDISINPKTGKVYFLMTGNRARKNKDLNAANKVVQGGGHIIEASADHHLTKAQWKFLIICGQSFSDKENGTFNQKTSPKGRFVYPDNAAFDPQGNMWVCSDGYGFPGFSDGLWHCQIDGEQGLSKRFATAPVRSEFTGPFFTQDGKNLFLAVQHPGTVMGGSFPDFDFKRKARSAVVVINKD